MNDLAVMAALPETMVFRHLHTVLAMQMVEHEASTDRNRAWLGLWWLSHAANRQACRPTLRRLQQRFNEAVNFGVLSGNEVIYLDIVESERSLRMQARIGTVTSSIVGRLARRAFRPPTERDTLAPGLSSSLRWFHRRQSNFARTTARTSSAIRNVGPETLTAAMGQPSAFTVAAATQRIPISFSSSSIA
jgi:DNA-binding IclR family transcriptional regulator